MSEIQGLAPPDTQPTTSIPLPLPSTPPPVPSLKTIQSYLPFYLSKTDALISRLSTILSTPGGTDSLLCTLCYSSLLTSNLLSRFSLLRLHHIARLAIEKAISLPPNTTVIIDTSSIPASRTAIAATRLKALSSLISDFRIFARLWGLVGIYKWGRGVLKADEKDPVLKYIAHAQVAVNVLYQYLENGAYLASKGVLGWDTAKQNRAWIWSSRWWMAHVLLDFVRLAREATTGKDRGEEGDMLVAEQKWKVAWRKEMLVNAAWLPLTIHWGLEEGLVSEFWIGVLGTVAGGMGLTRRWRDAGV